MSALLVLATPAVTQVLAQSTGPLSYGLTPMRIWATTAVLVALVGAIIGGVALARSTRRTGSSGRNAAIVALVAGLMAATNGALNLAVADGGPGTGNGVVGGAGALVLGSLAAVLGWSALVRYRRTA